MKPFTLSPTKTPATLSPNIRRACAQFVPGVQPVFVERKPQAGARINKCTLNVREYLRGHPGEMVLGWEVTAWDGVLLQCIGHAVVRNGSDFICVTPSKYPEQKLLFLPDPSISFDFDDENARMPSTMLALSSRPEVAKFIELTRLEYELKIKYPVSSQPQIVEGEDAHRLQRIKQVKSQLALRIVLITSDHNALCPCGSGKMFRKCHRPELERMLA